MKRTSFLLGLGIFGVLLLTRCGHRDSDARSLGDDFTVVPMAEYKFEPSGIKTGDAITILAYSGGQRSKDKKLYYSQFMVIDKSTGDTTRILSAMISVDSVPGSPSEIFTPADGFDGTKGVVDAIFETPNSNNMQLMNVVANMPADGDGKELPKDILDSAGTKEYVLINKKDGIFVNTRYKTAKGILRFHDQPF